MFDLKVMRSALDQLEEERKIPKAKIIDAIEQALAAAYKKDYGKKGQIVRATFDLASGKTEFFQVKKVVDESLVRMGEPGEEEEEAPLQEGEVADERPWFNPEQHMLIADAKKMKKDVALEEEIVFPLESKDDYGRIAAQTAKQVIIQRIREAERSSVLDEFGGKSGSVVSGVVQRMERGNVFLDLGRTTGILAFDEQIPTERYRQGERLKAYLYSVEETPRGINIRLSRTHPKFIEELFKQEAPEIASGVVEVKAIAREPGSRSKIAVRSLDPHVDPVGSCVGQRGVRVSTVMQELGGEKIDIIEWSEDPKKFVPGALSPAKVQKIEIDEVNRHAKIIVAEDQQSLAIGKGGQNVRLAAKLTGYKIDISSSSGQNLAESDGEATAPAAIEE
ncbi:transcription termination factor NusA [Candidatus Parcubacteria bacterium]|nr:transcription termination factor NusA [Candidatus Parcubacteria bacterium]